MCQTHVLVRSSESNKDCFEDYNRDQRKVVVNKGFRRLGQCGWKFHKKFQGIKKIC
jgi:hypothetical protein